MTLTPLTGRRGEETERAFKCVSFCILWLSITHTDRGLLVRFRKRNFEDRFVRFTPLSAMFTIKPNPTYLEKQRQATCSRRI